MAGLQIADVMAENEARNNSETLIARCRQELSRLPGIRLGIVYGSTVTGRLRPDSDVDVAVLSEKPLGLPEILSLTDRLSSVCHREIDLIDLDGLCGEILRQVLCGGRIVVKKDVDALYRLLQRMIYDEADFLPLVRRSQRERLRRFIDERL